MVQSITRYNPGKGEFLLSAIDNVRPANVGSWMAFLFSHMSGSPAASFGYDPHDDDLGGFRGTFAPGGQGAAHAGWLVVQGHSHMPAMKPGEYYNTVTWVDLVDFRKGAGAGVQETILRVLPFLIVLKDQRGKRVEHFFTVNVSDTGRAVIVRRQRAMINRLRAAFGCPPM